MMRHAAMLYRIRAAGCAAACHVTFELAVNFDKLGCDEGSRESYKTPSGREKCAHDE